MQKIMFLDENHMRFYKEVMDKIRDAYDGIEPDVYHKSLIYPPHGEKTPTDESRSGMNRLMGL